MIRWDSDPTININNDVMILLLQGHVIITQQSNREEEYETEDEYDNNRSKVEVAVEEVE
jgi:hypothetical protein